MLELMQQLPGAPGPAKVQAVLDIGCATGLSSLALRQCFPAAHVTGVDLSPYMVAVGQYHQQRREVSTGLGKGCPACSVCNAALHLTEHHTQRHHTRRALPFLGRPYACCPPGWQRPGRAAHAAASQG
jgi:trans-aconitate methyltransferase